MLIHMIAAARPNFMKVAPLYHALKNQSWAEPNIVHTGQHYDLNMSDVFFKDLMLPEPDVHLGVGSGSHAKQTGEVMIAYEKLLSDKAPDLVVVVGDVNSTMAATLAAAKLGIKVAHLEAGLRSFDRTMPEEINRLVTDSLADLLWTPSPDGDKNLIREGVSPEKIDRVGNIMIDSLEMLKDRISKQTTWQDYDLNQKEYGLVTLHRPANVDDSLMLEKLCQLLIKVSNRIPLIFPVHPRTKKNLENHGYVARLLSEDNLIVTDPLGYKEFMNLLFNCRFALTDSGGIQEETTYLGVPCFTLRPNTERPITVTHGTNQLCDISSVENKIFELLAGAAHNKSSIELWDGNTAARVVQSIQNHII